jgi:hypothetical protein
MCYILVDEWEDSAYTREVVEAKGKTWNYLP